MTRQRAKFKELCLAVEFSQAVSTFAPRLYDSANATSFGPLDLVVKIRLFAVDT